MGIKYSPAFYEVERISAVCHSIVRIIEFWYLPVFRSESPEWISGRGGYMGQILIAVLSVISAVELRRRSWRSLEFTVKFSQSS
jgi:hypothetical protein